MKTDIEIAQEAVMQPIKEVAASYGIGEDDLELYGKYKAKLSDELWEKVKGRPDGKLVLVTAINPTPAGEGRRSSWQDGQKCHHRLKRTIPWTVLWHQRRSSRRRLRTGTSYGRSEPSFYR